ncbi:unnamed protein product [Adineta steineri]|uniref:F-box domain-containing protein n=1 Tax=Adineta steineri TaxID=433720 RepID=A0A814WRU8_9BILA|nr:unnamed protein product [Adineta steineri]CAF1439268.1 unnamed protein product [Adineta steineri]CAF4004143.1 unnamed protein product [Adineta steineri]CAF4028706.1 unnamed protein product [Adineta steineri]
MYLEQLPDELLLFIFGYLQKCDLFYAFSQLNRRFQQILDPYSYTIDLTEKSRPSYRQFRLFLDYVLPLYRRNIRLLKISGQHQFQLLKNQINSFSNLQTLVIEEEDCEEDEFDSIKDDQHNFLHEAFEVPSLISLTVSFAWNDVLTLLTNSKLSKLVNLNLFYFCGLSDVIDEVSHLPTSITCLKVALASVTPLPKLFRLMPHLISINLLMITFDGLILNNAWELPEKLEELYLEFGQYKDEDQPEVQPKMNVIKMFLECFKEKLRVLTLVVTNAELDFSNFDKLNNLVSNFDRLQTFNYSILTSYEATSLYFPYVQKLHNASCCISTIPIPQSLNAFKKCQPLLEYTPTSLTFEDVCNSSDLQNCQKLRIHAYNELVPIKLQLSDKTKFLNLRRIYMYHIEALQIDVLWLLSLFLQRSPNVNFLHVTTTNTEKAIKQIEQIIMPLTKAQKNQITHFELSVFSDEDEQAAIKNYHYHPTFFSELSKLGLSKSLRTLNFYSEQLFTDDNYYKSLREFISTVSKDFEKMTNLTVEMRSVTNVKDYNEFDVFKEELYELKKTVYFTEKLQNGSYYINFWL